jgi:hypothetical protein
MDIVLSRILKYLNGCLEDNYMYRVGIFIVKIYTHINCYSLEDIVNEGHFNKDEVLDFVNHFGFDTYEEFREQLWINHETRLTQIQLRTIDTDIESFLGHLNVSSSKEEFLQLIDDLCDLIFKKERVIIIGSHFPISLAVDFQTDLISLGKEVIQYHHFDENFKFTDKDIVFFITATGRMLHANVKTLKPQNICDSDIVLVTQNIKYIKIDDVCADYVAHVLGKYDGIEFNYQVLMIFDLLRIRYFYKYFQ